MNTPALQSRLFPHDRVAGEKRYLKGTQLRFCVNRAIFNVKQLLTRAAPEDKIHRTAKGKQARSPLFRILFHRFGRKTRCPFAAKRKGGRRAPALDDNISISC